MFTSEEAGPKPELRSRHVRTDLERALLAAAQAEHGGMGRSAQASAGRTDDQNLIAAARATGKRFLEAAFKREALWRERAGEDPWLLSVELGTSLLATAANVEAGAASTAVEEEVAERLEVMGRHMQDRDMDVDLTDEADVSEVVRLYPQWQGRLFRAWLTWSCGDDLPPGTSAAGRRDIILTVVRHLGTLMRERGAATERLPQAPEPLGEPPPPSALTWQVIEQERTAAAHGRDAHAAVTAVVGRGSSASTWADLTSVDSAVTDARHKAILARDGASAALRRAIALAGDTAFVSDLPGAASAAVAIGRLCQSVDGATHAIETIEAEARSLAALIRKEVESARTTASLRSRLAWAMTAALAVGRQTEAAQSAATLGGFIGGVTTLLLTRMAELEGKAREAAGDAASIALDAVASAGRATDEQGWSDAVVRVAGARAAFKARSHSAEGWLTELRAAAEAHGLRERAAAATESLEVMRRELKGSEAALLSAQNVLTDRLAAPRRAVSTSQSTLDRDALAAIATGRTQAEVCGQLGISKDVLLAVYERQGYPDGTRAVLRSLLRGHLDWERVLPTLRERIGTDVEAFYRKLFSDLDRSIILKAAEGLRYSQIEATLGWGTGTVGDYVREQLYPKLNVDNPVDAALMAVSRGYLRREELAEALPARPPELVLSERDRTVLQLVVRRASPEEITEATGVQDTRALVAKLSRKLGTRNQNQTALWAYVHGEADWNAADTISRIEADLTSAVSRLVPAPDVRALVELLRGGTYESAGRLTQRSSHVVNKRLVAVYRLLRARSTTDAIITLVALGVISIDDVAPELGLSPGSVIRPAFTPNAQA